MQEKKPLIIVGAGGHGRVVLDVALSSCFAVVGFIDNGEEEGSRINGFPILGKEILLHNPEIVQQNSIFVAIGNQAARLRHFRTLKTMGATLPSIIHPSAIISRFATIGEGTVIVAGAIVNANASIGNFCIINTAATIDHDDVLEDGVQICPGAHLAGTVTCRKWSFVGTGANVIPNKIIGEWSIVGAGSTVIKDVPANAMALGVPARLHRQSSK